MASLRRIAIFSMILWLTANMMSLTAFADDHKHKKEKQHQTQKKNKSSLAIVNAQYEETCGECHFAYQPELLPSASWTKIIEGLEDHFGETIELDPETAKLIAAYLKSNAAEISASKLANKILKSIDEEIPARITEVPYIRKAHREIRLSVINRKSIGTLSNCSACHTTAGNGIYDDDNVKIPKEEPPETSKSQPPQLNQGDKK